MKFLFVVMMGLISLSASAQRGVPGFCKSADLYSTEGMSIYSFNFASNCSAALEQSKLNEGRFCDYETLVKADGSVAHRLTFPSDCTDALKDLSVSKYGLFCDDGDLYQIYRSRIAEMSFSHYCRRATQESGAFRGLFCDDAQMMNHRGQKLRDYSFASSCRDALPTVSRSITF